SSFGLGSWVLEKKDPDTGDWVQIDSGSNTNTVSVTGEACSEYRLRLTSAPAPGITGCEDQDVEPVEKEKEVQFAQFTLCHETTKAAPDGTVKRTRIGILEGVAIRTVEDVPVEWAVTFENGQQDT